MISISEVGMGVLQPESEDVSISVGNQVRIDVSGPDQGAVYQVQQVFFVTPPLPTPPIPSVRIGNSTKSVYPVSDVTRMDLLGEIVGPDLPVQKLRIRAEGGITMSVADRPDDSFTRPAVFPAPTGWMEFEDVGNLKNILFQGPVDKKIYLMWSIV